MAYSDMKYKRLLTLSTVLFLSAMLFSFGSKKQTQQTEPALEESIKKGKEIFNSYCMSCHMAEGEGVPGVYPPLAGSDYLMEDKERSIQIVMHGTEGEIVVNGQTYNMPMPSMNLSNEQVTHVLNYVRNSWGNEGEVVSFEEVKAVREKTK